MNELENKKEYEMPYLLTPEISEDKIDSEIAELKNIIAENGGDVSLANLPEKRRLAYPVKKQNQAFFGVFYFNIDADGLDKVKKVLALHKKVLRFLILNKAIKPKTSPAIALQSDKTEETPAPSQSFDQKLENILKGRK